ncbi:MAG: agmatine deiminase family protein [Candidatus Cloacimonetes bacterium]|nr:agmatine deiminase family protein [Candidatus Cloacimonadota bacterium]
MRERLILMILILTFALNLSATFDLIKMTEEWFRDNPESLPQWMTPEEMARIDEIGTRIDPTDPPSTPVRNVAEFEPMTGVLIRYPLGIPVSLVAHISQHATIVTIVSSTSVQNQAINAYNNGSVNLANCEFMIAPTDSYWTRDYGPFFIFDGNNELGVVNFSYNRPRPNDDNIPVVFANQYDLPLYGMNILHTGGNFMSNSFGTGAASHIVYTENSSYTHQQIDQFVEDYMGITEHLVIPDPNGTYINHIDCWAKFLAPDKVLVRSVPTNHSQYNQIEGVVDYFETLTSPYGTPYRIYRVYTPNNQPYTNSVIVNDKVYVPIMNSTWDNAALASYEDAMPGYEVVGFYSSSWVSTDAIHCRVKEIADSGMLYIRHLPFLGEQPYNTEYVIDAYIFPYSGEALYADSLKVYYKINSGQYQSVPLVTTNDYNFTAALTEFTAGDTLSYYLYASDGSGRTAKHPFIGAPDPHNFVVGYESTSPTILHNPITEVYLNDLPVAVEAEVTDPSGIVSVELEYRINGEESQFLQFDNINGDSYTCDFGQDLNVEDLVEYKIIATNMLVPAQTSYLPAEGWFSFIIDIRQVTEPVFDPEQGLYEETINVTIGCDTQGAVIYYTLDESIPDEESLLYTEPILISESVIIKAIAVLDLFLPSEIATAEYMIEEVSTDDIPIVASYRLFPAYPNPFNPTVNISFSLPEATFVSLEIFNIQGKKISTLIADYYFQGDHSLIWNGRDSLGKEIAAGVYFYRITTAEFAETRKMILLK